MKKNETEFNFLSIYSKKKISPFYQKCRYFLSTVLGTLFFLFALGLAHYLNDDQEIKSKDFIFNPQHYFFSSDSHLSDENKIFFEKSVRKCFYNE